MVPRIDSATESATESVTDILSPAVTEATDLRVEHLADRTRLVQLIYIRLGKGFHVFRHKSRSLLVGRRRRSDFLDDAAQ